MTQPQQPGHGPRKPRPADESVTLHIPLTLQQHARIEKRATATGRDKVTYVKKLIGADLAQANKEADLVRQAKDRSETRVGCLILVVILVVAFGLVWAFAR